MTFGPDPAFAASPSSQSSLSRPSGLQSGVGFTPELVERLNEGADWLAGGELDGLRLSVGGVENIMREAASGIAELTAALECIHKHAELVIRSGSPTKRDLAWISEEAACALAKARGPA